MSKFFDRWWRLLLAWALMVALTWGSAFLSLYRSPPPDRTDIKARTPVEALSTWDGTHYRYIATRGYVAEGVERRQVNFFPLYPLLARTAGGESHAVLAGIVLSQILALGSLFLMSLLAHGSRRAPILEEPGFWLLIYPSSFFLMTFYAESLLLFLTLVHVAAANSGRYGISFVSGYLSGLTRPTAIVLPVLMAVEAFQQERRDRKWLALLTTAAAPVLGFATFTLVYVGLMTGSITGYASVENEFWKRTTIVPLQDFAEGLLSWLSTLRQGQIPPPDVVLRSFSTVTVISILIWQRRRIPVSWLAYSAAVLLLIHTFRSSQGPGSLRYEASLFPVFFGLAGSGIARWRFVWPLVIVLVAIWLFLLNRFATWRWVA